MTFTNTANANKAYNLSVAGSSFIMDKGLVVKNDSSD